MREGFGLAANKMDQEIDLANNQLHHKFLLYIVSLIFTSLSLSLQFKLATSNSLFRIELVFKFLELFSWILFLLAGFLGLMLLRCFVLPTKVPYNSLGKFFNIFIKETAMWLLFFLAIILQICCRAGVLFTYIAGPYMII